MTGTPDPPRGADPDDRRLRRSWWSFAGCLAILTAVAAARLVAEGPTPVDLLIGALVVGAAVAAVLHRQVLERLAIGRRAEAESVARILQGLSRSVSPDAIVQAIVADLGVAAGADHVVVVRRRPETGALEATLVSSRPGVPSSTTLVPRSDVEEVEGPDPAERVATALRVAMATQLTAATVRAGVGPLRRPGGSSGHSGSVRESDGPPRGRGSSRRAAMPSAPGGTRGRRAASLRGRLERLAGARPAGRVAGTAPGIVGGSAGRAAERLAARARDVYGLRNTLAAPLEGDGGVVGAIVLARRAPDPWPPVARRLLTSAAVEASAALARATHHRAAEAGATTDALTGLPNRRYFDEFCGLLARRRRADDAVGVLLVDIDHFKRVNDEHGHSVGDEVLRAVARAIGRTVREHDVPARFGGEEFVVVLRNPGRDVAVEVAERIRTAIAALDLRELGPASVTVSIGVAFSEVDDEPIRDLIEHADRALYEAKRGGRNRVVAAA